MEILQIHKTTFDGMENRIEAARETKLVATFADGDGKSAYARACEWFKKLGPEVHYPGWDGEVYPKYELKKETVNG